uniref:Uncharacterized protein n=1 Tax=Anopheles culicifacies TaxID=139723 RepID=A0A182MSC7_9DIPT
MSEASLRANSCVELSEIRKLDSLLRQCETLSYDDLSSGSNGERELEDYMEQRKHYRRRRNSSGNCIFTPPISKSTLSMLSSLNFLNGARKIMGAMNKQQGGMKTGTVVDHPDDCWLLSQKSFTTKSCSNLPKGLCFPPTSGSEAGGKPLQHQQADNLHSLSETILSNIRKAAHAVHMKPSNRETCRCDSSSNANKHPPNTLQLPPASITAAEESCCADSAKNVYRKNQCLAPDEDNRIVNIIETPNIVPISMKSLNSALSDRLCYTAKAQKSFDNKSDKSLLSQANSVKSRSKFSPLSRKVSHKTNSFDTEPAEGAKESLLGHKFEKILPEPVETVSS